MDFEEYVSELLNRDDMTVIELKRLVFERGRSDDYEVYSKLTTDDFNARDEIEAYIRQAEEDGSGISVISQQWNGRR